MMDYRNRIKDQEQDDGLGYSMMDQEQDDGVGMG